jgi:protein-S-isoprenylcysteine O-methyltransferase Ste14
VVDDEEFDEGLDAVVVVFVFVFVVSLVFSFTTVEAGLTTVVLFSVFFSAGAAGATVSVFCSHAPRSAAPAKMQINFFIGLVGRPRWG